MKYIKHIILTAMAVVVMTGAWAQTSPERQSDDSWKFTMPAANKLLEVENYNTYTLTLASNDNTMGTVKLLNSYTLTFTGVNSSAEPIVIPYYYGDSITLDRTCSQMAQYFFGDFQYMMVSTPPNISCDQQGLTVKGVFADTQELTLGNKTIQVTCTPNMSNVIKTGDNEYIVIDGAVVTVKATPADNYRFVNWTDENSNVMGTDAQLTFTVTGDTAVTGNFAGQESRLDSVRTTWEVYINGASTAVHPTPYSDTDTMGYVIIPAGADVMITPKPEGQAAMVSKLELIDKTAPSCRRVDLSQITADSVIQDCDTLTGTLNANVKISIAAGATVTLDGVSINANGNWTSGYYAGITCEGDATLILKDGTTNTVKGFYREYPGIYVPVDSTLTIQGGASGTGKLIASSNGWGAGIGGGFGTSLPCGNIRIEGGIIEATGGVSAAGIGNGYAANCGAITITGGNVNATGGESAAGIGSGYEASCSAITITSGVTSVTATKGEYALNSIGAGEDGTCGTITFGTQQMYNGTTWTTTPTSGQTYGGLKFSIKTTSITDDTWELTCRRVDLSQITADSVMQDGDVLTGTLTANVKISIADGATVTLDNASINADGNKSGNKAGITCAGDATITLEGTNTVKGFADGYPGIFVSSGKTLVINGTGELNASSNGSYITGSGGAGIGGGNNMNCGNIEIQSGTVTATGNQYGAGIGGGQNANCGNITISGGTVTATGGYRAAGIGGGRRGNSGTKGGYDSGSCGNITISGGTVTATGGGDAAGIGGGRGYNTYFKSSCGTITITSGVTRVTATKGADATNSIGAGSSGICDTITFGNQQMYDGSTWTTTPTSGQTYGGLNFTIKTTTSNNDTWELTPPSN